MNPTSALDPEMSARSTGRHAIPGRFGHDHGVCDPTRWALPEKWLTVLC